MVSRTLLIATLSLLPFAALAVETKNDNALYDPTPPADSAFVRLANGLPGGATKADIDGTALGSVAYPGLSDYKVIKAGEHEAHAGGATQKVTVAAGKYYTLALKGDKTIATLEDATITQPAKATVYLYNLSDAATAAVNAPAFKTDIVGGVAAGASSSKEVNAVTLDADVTADGAKVASFPKVALKRRTGFSFLLTGKGADKKAIQVENKVKP